jgi:hypothetical protein
MSEVIQNQTIETPVELDELSRANKKILELYHFIEMTEALTYDEATSKRISDFLIAKGVWKPLDKKDNNN